MKPQPLSPDLKEFLDKSSSQSFLKAAKEFVALIEAKNNKTELVIFITPKKG